MTLDTLKLDFARRTRRGLNNIIAGILLWSLFAILGIVLADWPQKALIYLFGAGMLFPLGLASGAALKFDVFAKGNPPGLLAGLIGGLQILFIPLMLGAYFTTPQMAPWYLAVLVGAHFLPFSWLYEGQAYRFAAVATSIGAGLSGWLLPNNTFVVTPLIVVVILVATAVLLQREIAADRSRS